MSKKSQFQKAIYKAINKYVDTIQKEIDKECKSFTPDIDSETTLSLAKFIAAKQFVSFAEKLMNDSIIKPVDDEYVDNHNFIDVALRQSLDEVYTNRFIRNYIYNVNNKMGLKQQGIYDHLDEHMINLPAIYMFNIEQDEQ